MATIENSLGYELGQLEGARGWDLETGRKISNNGVGGSRLSAYTTRLFGAPFQLLDTVDGRFPEINSQVGNEYLRNFLLNSPILSIRPGMPRYTGGKDPTSFASGVKNVYYDMASGGKGLGEAVLDEMAKNLIFGHGAKFQRRMFGFRETYYDYMQHVNLMCRSVAIFLNLTGNSAGGLPTGCYMSGGGDMVDFRGASWENYRMFGDSTTLTPYQYLCELLQVPVNEGKNMISSALGVGIDALAFAGSIICGGDSTDLSDAIGSFIGLGLDQREANYEAACGTSLASTLASKVDTVQFMVEPTEFSESLQNTSEPSIVETMVDGLNSIGYELAWITNSKADIGMLNGILDFMGDGIESALTTISGLVSNFTGGFLDNVFSGAIRSFKGQKMIYPEIYKSSKSTMNYEFTVTLSSPYGDIYNYYMNIIVPLMHLIALAAPRMVTANSIASPYLVQAFIPGMCTCQLGIVEQMSIQKNPTGKHVSVNGFPLTVKVHFVVKELYNALSISPAYDPSSFYFNETLNDYMANLAGLIPSVDTFTEQRQAMFDNFDSYLEKGEFINDMVSPMVEWAENKISPYT